MRAIDYLITGIFLAVMTVICLSKIIFSLNSISDSISFTIGAVLLIILGAVAHQADIENNKEEEILRKHESKLR